MQAQLSTAGVNPSVLFPDLGGVADLVTWSHHHLKGELDTRIQSLL